jgi:hypothetical protein
LTRRQTPSSDWREKNGAGPVEPTPKTLAAIRALKVDVFAAKLLGCYLFEPVLLVKPSLDRKGGLKFAQSALHVLHRTLMTWSARFIGAHLLKD